MQPFCVPATSPDGIWMVVVSVHGPKSQPQGIARPLCRSWIVPGAAPKPECIHLSSLMSLRGSCFSNRPPITNGRRPKGTLFTGRASYSGSAVSKHLTFQKKVSLLLESPLPPLKTADTLRGPRIITAPRTTPKMTNLEMQFAEV